MKNNKNIDERVVLVKRKLQSEGFMLMYFILAITMFTQASILQAPVEQYAGEFTIFMAMSLYTLLFDIKNGQVMRKTHDERIVAKTKTSQLWFYISTLYNDCLNPCTTIFTKIPTFIFCS